MENGKKSDSDAHDVSWGRKYIWLLIFIFCEGLVMLFLGLFFTFGKLTGPVNAKASDEESTKHFALYYPLFQDVHVMIFIGFGFLYTYLKSHSWTSVAFNFIVGAWTIQISLLLLGFWEAVCLGKWHEKIELDLTWMINADFAAASILISFGGVLGKFSLPQYMTMAFLETIVYCVNYRIGEKNLHAIDAGGSMYIHTFGAYFGLTVTWIMFYKEENKCVDNPENGSDYNSNIFGFIGTIFLWLYWPSFNGALVGGAARYRVIINTYLSLTGSCIMTYVMSMLLKGGKLHMEDVLNASVAGGVIVGGNSDTILYPWAGLVVGLVGGFVSTVGFEVFSPFLSKKLHLYDTAGIHNLHGMPGFLGGIITAICAGGATPENWGESLTMVFPAMEHRSNGLQAGYQLAALALTLGLAITGGVLTGLILKSRIFYQIDAYYVDNPFWVIEEDEPVLPFSTQRTFELQSNVVEKEKLKGQSNGQMIATEQLK